MSTDATTSSNRSSTAARLGRIAVATGVLGGAVTVAGGHLASAADGDLPSCIDAIQGVDTTGWVLSDWYGFI